MQNVIVTTVPHAHAQKPNPKGFSAANRKGKEVSPNLLLAMPRLMAGEILKSKKKHIYWYSNNIIYQLSYESQIRGRNTPVPYATVENGVVSMV